SGSGHPQFPLVALEGKRWVSAVEHEVRRSLYDLRGIAAIRRNGFEIVEPARRGSPENQRSIAQRERAGGHAVGGEIGQSCLPAVSSRRQFLNTTGGARTERVVHVAVEPTYEEIPSGIERNPHGIRR